MNSFPLIDSKPPKAQEYEFDEKKVWKCLTELVVDDFVPEV
jgi:hypothetical protein